MKFSENSFLAGDKSNNVFYSVWEPDNPPKAALQICHGMCEYVGRYADFAAFLASKGYVVFGNDHIGHGRSVKDDSDLGFLPRKSATKQLVDDAHTLTRMMKEKYRGIPFFLLGHSMGSFIARLYLSEYGGELDGAVIMGTGGPGSPTGAGKLLSEIIALFKGDHYRSKLIDKVAFGSFNSHFKDENSSGSWLSSNKETVEKYENDKYCTFLFTVDGFYTLFNMLGIVSSKKWAFTVPKKLPVLIVSGAEDPVGNYGKGPQTVYDRLVKAGLEDVSIKLYKGARHEILNDTVAADAYADLLGWLDVRGKRTDA